MTLFILLVKAYNFLIKIFISGLLLMYKLHRLGDAFQGALLKIMHIPSAKGIKSSSVLGKTVFLSFVIHCLFI